MSDPVNKPSHYTSSPSGVECLDVVEHLCFNLGNAVKYIWRCDLKGKPIEDLKKAAFYINREIARREKAEYEQQPTGGLTMEAAGAALKEFSRAVARGTNDEGGRDVWKESIARIHHVSPTDIDWDAEHGASTRTDK